MKSRIENNLTQIKALRNSRIQSTRVHDILCKRIAEARKRANSLRQYASKKAGHVADACNAIADMIESVI